MDENMMPTDVQPSEDNGAPTEENATPAPIEMPTEEKTAPEGE